VRPLAGKRPGARRVAAALLGLGGDALARGARVVTGREPGAPAEPALPEDPAATEAAWTVAAEEAAARLDAARDRLRATIAPPDDEEPQPDPQRPPAP
jgi:hypothetical protein